MLQARLGSAAAVRRACYLPQCSRDPAPRKSPNTCRPQTSPPGVFETGDRWEPGAAHGTHRCAAQRGLSYVSDFVDARNLRSKARTVVSPRTTRLCKHSVLALSSSPAQAQLAAPYTGTPRMCHTARLHGRAAWRRLSPVPLCHNTLKAAHGALLLLLSTHLWKRQVPLQRWPLSPPGLRTCCPSCASPGTDQGNNYPRGVSSKTTSLRSSSWQK